MGEFYVDDAVTDREIASHFLIRRLVGIVAAGLGNDAAYCAVMDPPVPFRVGVRTISGYVANEIGSSGPDDPVVTAISREIFWTLRDRGLLQPPVTTENGEPEYRVVLP